jgi:hypothetical protein
VLDSRVFRLLCDPGQAAALANFLASLESLGLAPEGDLPDLEVTPLAILDVIGVEPPQFPAIPLPKCLADLDNVDVSILLKEMVKKEFRKEPKLDPAGLKQRVEELRRTANPAAHELIVLCLTRLVSHAKFEEYILEQLTFDALFTFRFSEEYKERMNHLFDSCLLNSDGQISGLTRMRRLRLFWDKSLERILKKNPQARREILAADQEMKPRTFRDFLAWELIHYSVLGYARKRVHPVMAFTLEPEERLRARCRAHKTALRAFLDEISQEELAGVLRPLLAAWRPGSLVPCPVDGTLEAPVSTGEVPIWAGA